MPDQAQAVQELFDVLTHVLAHTTDLPVVELAARSLARHSDPEGRSLLLTFLRSREFVGRLDEVTDPGAATLRLAHVFAALREHPDGSVRALCLALSRDRGFVSIDDRNGLLLVTLAEVRPMDEATVAFFEHTNQTGYAPINAPLLLHNASPNALALFERMIADTSVAPEDHADTLHTGLMPNRTDPAIVALAERLLDAGLPEMVNAGVVESLYDFRSREWFGPAINPPSPPAWESASTAVLLHLIALAPRAQEAAGVSPALAAAVQATEQTLRALVASRAPQ